MEQFISTNALCPDSVALVKPNNSRKQNKIVYVTGITTAKVTTSHLISNYKKSCNAFYPLAIHHKALIVLSPVALHTNASAIVKPTKNMFKIKCFPILNNQHLCQPLEIIEKEFDTLQSSLLDVIQTIFKDVSTTTEIPLLFLNKHQHFKISNTRHDMQRTKDDIVSFIFDDHQLTHNTVHSLKISLCMDTKSFINTIRNHNDIQCIFPFHHFSSLLNHATKKTESSYNANSNPYSTYMNTDYYTNFDKTDINHLLFDVICPDSRNGNLLVLDNSDLASTQTFYEDATNTHRAMIPTPWYHSGFGGIVDAVRTLNDTQQKQVYVMNNLWFDCCKIYLPNEKFKMHSFKMVYYDGTCTYEGTKRKKCINREINPKNDIEIVFQKRLFLKHSVSYFALTVSIRGFKDGKKLFTQRITEDITEIAAKYDYKINDCQYVHDFKSRKMLLLVYNVHWNQRSKPWKYVPIYYGLSLLLLVSLIYYFYKS